MALCDQVFCGTIVHSTLEDPMSVVQNKVIGVNTEGCIMFVDDVSKLDQLKTTFDFNDVQITHLTDHQFIIPGFIDTHIHAPQYSYVGTGYDLPLLKWLNKYTFPVESKFLDTEFARRIYRKVVTRTLNSGTTTASYFATIHYNATTVLADVVEDLGQRAYVGKVCMDTNSPEYYIETTEQSIQDTEKFIQYVQAKNNPLITPVITPRFLVSCTGELMKNLADLARKYQLPVQSHLNESTNEISLVSKMFPDCDNNTQVFKKYGLLSEKSYMAHCCHMSSEEACMLAQTGTGISHCPASNINLRSGHADVRFLENNNIKLGLGTDIAGGHSYSMLNAIQSAISVSNVIAINTDGYKPISHREAFYMATLGGSKVLGLDKRIGSFEVGKEFDAILVDAVADDSPFDCYDDDDMEDIVQKFLYCGDDRNIKRVFVSGKFVAGRDHKKKNIIIVLSARTSIGTRTYQTRVIYNRVGKCGSRYILELLYRLAERNGFKVIDSIQEGTLDSHKRKFSANEQRKFVKYITQEPEPPFVFHGHFHYIDFTRFSAANPVYINLIRDPVQRFMSAYYFRRFGDDRNRTWSFQGTVKEKNMTLDECVLKSHPECTNPNKVLYILSYFCGQARGCRGSSIKSLRRAILNVQHKYLVVGILEDVHSFIKVLEKLLPHLFKGAYELRTKTVSESKKSTKTRNKRVLSPKATKILKHRLRLEYRFYNFVKVTFDKLKKTLEI